MTSTIIRSLLLWGLGACVIFTGLLGLGVLLGVTRDENGKRRKNTGPAGPVLMLLMIGFMVAFPLLPMRTAWQIAGEKLPFFWNACIAYGIFFLVNLYDLVVLDWLVVVKWHPSFLHMPSTPYYTTLLPHVRGFCKGLVIGLPIALISGALNLIF